MSLSPFFARRQYLLTMGAIPDIIAICLKEKGCDFFEARATGKAEGRKTKAVRAEKTVTGAAAAGAFAECLVRAVRPCGGQNQSREPPEPPDQAKDGIMK